MKSRRATEHGEATVFPRSADVVQMQSHASRDPVSVQQVREDHAAVPLTSVAMEEGMVHRREVHKQVRI